MSTLDVVAQAGGKAANFLDVGGGASAETMADGLEVILSDDKVRSVLVNIFGGITRGDLVAQGILDALDRLGDKVKVPLVVRLDGTNAEEGRALLAGSPSEKVVPAATMLDAARKAVELADQRQVPEHGHPRRRPDPAGRAGPDRPRGPLPRPAQPRVRHQLVAGVTPGKAGQDVEGVPVFNTVASAVAETGANTSLIFVPARFAVDALYEAADAGIEVVVLITENIPVLDMTRAYNYIKAKGVALVGPNCPGSSRPARRTSASSPARSPTPGRSAWCRARAPSPTR